MAARYGALTKTDATREERAGDPSEGAPTKDDSSDDAPDEAHGRVDLAAQPGGDAPAEPGRDA